MKVCPVLAFGVSSAGDVTAPPRPSPPPDPGGGICTTTARCRVGRICRAVHCKERQHQHFPRRCHDGTANQFQLQLGIVTPSSSERYRYKKSSDMQKQCHCLLGQGIGLAQQILGFTIRQLPNEESTIQERHPLYFSYWGIQRDHGLARPRAPPTPRNLGHPPSRQCA
jgi:hypothetical protein